MDSQKLSRDQNFAGDRPYTFDYISRYSLWDCRETKLSPSVNGFRFKLQIKYETEKYIATKDNILSGFKNAQNIDKSSPLYFVGLCYNVTMNKNTFSLASLHARARYNSL